MHVRIPIPYARKLKAIMPKSLFARALLIMLLPMVILQFVALIIFYERHWDSVVRNLAFATSLDVELLVHEYSRVREDTSETIALSHVQRLATMLNMQVRIEPTLGASSIKTGKGRNGFPDLHAQVARVVDEPFMITGAGPDHIRISVAMQDGLMYINLPRKRIASSTTYLFVFWMLGSSLILTVIATLFLRSQIRPIVQLARASEQFGLGRDVEKFSPRGASEVRRAGKAFVVMAERIRRQVQSRTEMLAGISHDLRTPLTRMMLEVEMAKMDDASKEALTADIKEMRHMIDEYLNFARADKEELAAPVDIAAEIAQMAQMYARQNAALTYAPGAPLTLTVRRQALMRALQNLIDNALRYGNRAELSYEVSGHNLHIHVRDYGPGIPEESMAEVFRPFTRLEASRNAKTGGVGLGLSIARDNVQRLGGDIAMENICDEVGAVSGLRATIILPLGEG